MTALTPAQAAELRKHFGLTIRFTADLAYIGTVQERIGSRWMTEVADTLTCRTVELICADMVPRPAPRFTLEQRVAERYLFSAIFAG